MTQIDIHSFYDFRASFSIHMFNSLDNFLYDTLKIELYDKISIVYDGLYIACYQQLANN
jgi:hypothetical protein